MQLIEYLLGPATATWPVREPEGAPLGVLGSIQVGSQYLFEAGAYVRDEPIAGSGWFPLGADQAYVAASPSFDTATVAHALEEANIGLVGRSTGIGDGLGLALRRLDPRDAGQNAGQDAGVAAAARVGEHFAGEDLGTEGDAIARQGGRPVGAERRADAVRAMPVAVLRLLALDEGPHGYRAAEKVRVAGIETCRGWRPGCPAR